MMTKYIELAFGMLLETVAFGAYTYQGCIVEPVGKFSYLLRVHLLPKLPADRDKLASDLISIETNLKRSCFDYFTKSNMLVQPNIVVGEQAA